MVLRSATHLKAVSGSTTHWSVSRAPTVSTSRTGSKRRGREARASVAGCRSARRRILVSHLTPGSRGVALTSPDPGPPGCVYTSTAIPAIPTPVLRAATRTQVAVVGAGYTGLSAALHLAERGVPAVLLEAREPGWGAAGRNGGQVNAGLKHEPDQVERDLGPVHGPRLVRLAGEAPAYLFKLIDRLQINCE